MTKKRIIPFILMFLAPTFFLHDPATAYILKGSHILYLMIQNIGNPESLAVSQKLIFPTLDPSENALQIEEMLRYQFPEYIRSDTKSDQTLKIQVTSGGQTLTVVNGRISPSSETEIDHYRDILIYRNRILLENRLKILNIDVSVSSLGRFNGRIAYIIGATYPDNSKPQLWIDKETFRPIRLFIKNPVDVNSFLEFRYIIWQKIGGIWYPMQTNIYRGNQLIRNIKVSRIDVNPHFSEELFDIAHLRSIYPQKIPEADVAKEPDELSDDLKDMQQSIEDLKKIFE